jgi:hypothetical protein
MASARIPIRHFPVRTPDPSDRYSACGRGWRSAVPFAGPPERIAYTDDWAAVTCRQCLAQRSKKGTDQ